MPGPMKVTGKRMSWFLVDSEDCGMMHEIWVPEQGVMNRGGVV